LCAERVQRTRGICRNRFCTCHSWVVRGMTL
jgi:hypothetical protein